MTEVVKQKKLNSKLEKDISNQNHMVKYVKRVLTASDKALKT